MLTTLRIKNLALVTDLTLELRPGYNTITGETGAGKSILIGALNLVLGERADRALIRSGCDACTVEALFDVRHLRAPLKTFLEENGLEPCEGSQLVLKRTFSTSSATRQFINGSPTTLNLLSALGNWLVDVHGPHDHQSLLYPARQLEILDAFGNLTALRLDFAQVVGRHSALEAEKRALIVDPDTYARQLDLLRFQVNEITAAKLSTDEPPQLEQEYQRAGNAARLLELCRASLDLLGEDDQSLLSRSGALGRHLQQLQRLDPGAGPLATLHQQASALLRELQTGLSGYGHRVDIDPDRLREIEERLDLIHSLQRKYGSTLSDVLAFGEAARQKLQSLEARDAEISRLDAARQQLDSRLQRVGQELSAQRRKVIPRLCKAVTRQLVDLGFAQSQFDIALRSNHPRPTPPGPPPLSGFDSVEFQFAPNPGEPARPLRAIASSGELARVMLALKTVLAAEDEIPVLIFDEVDANVGGEAARAIGQKMQQIARQRQVLCITHLAPVAAPASAHFVVTKEVKDGRTISDIHLLTEPGDRVCELARMLGGQSDAARKHAEELLKI